MTRVAFARKRKSSGATVSHHLWPTWGRIDRISAATIGAAIAGILWLAASHHLALSSAAAGAAALVLPGQRLAFAGPSAGMLQESVMFINDCLAFTEQVPRMESRRAGSPEPNPRSQVGHRQSCDVTSLSGRSRTAPRSGPGSCVVTACPAATSRASREALPARQTIRDAVDITFCDCCRIHDDLTGSRGR